MPTQKDAGAIVFRRAQDTILYLLLCSVNGHWDIPKGGVEDKETLEETAIREVREETGITDLRFVTGFAEEIDYFFRQGGKTIHKSVCYFLTETTTFKVKISSEHTGYRWMTFEDASRHVEFENLREVLKKADTKVQTG